MDAVHPAEITIPSLRVAHQLKLDPRTYRQAMADELLQVDHLRQQALEGIIRNKAAVAEWYNPRVRQKKFEEGDLVWKVVFPIGIRDPSRGKWSPTWEGPYIVSEVLPNGAYRLIDEEGEEMTNPVNAKYLKKYYPSAWDEEC